MWEGGTFFFANLNIHKLASKDAEGSEDEIPSG